jgi:hypothetical protein
VVEVSRKTRSPRSPFAFRLKHVASALRPASHRRIAPAITRARGALRHVLTRSVLALRAALRMRPPGVPCPGAGQRYPCVEAAPKSRSNRTKGKGQNHDRIASTIRNTSTTNNAGFPRTPEAHQRAADFLADLHKQATQRNFTLADDAEYFRAQGGTDRRNVDTEIVLRELIERAIIRRAVTDILTADDTRTISVHDGAAIAQQRTRDISIIMAAIMSTGEDVLYVYHIPTVADAGVARLGWLKLIYGNGGYDVMADHTINIGESLQGASELADTLCDAI